MKNGFQKCFEVKCIFWIDNLNCQKNSDKIIAKILKQKHYFKIALKEQKKTQFFTTKILRIFYSKIKSKAALKF